MDMLSKLPDAILCHILSFVPTKTSVVCSVLSKRWKLLWTFVPVIDLDVKRDITELYDDDYEEYENKMKEKELRFLQIVDKVYSLPREFPVKKLRLWVQRNESSERTSYLQKWIADCRFEELDLSIPCSFFTFPMSSHYSNIVVLKLNHSCLGFVESCLFPKLRVLHLTWVSFEEKECGSLENFLSACPILEELVCKKIRVYNRSWRISTQTLTSLVLQGDDYDMYRMKFVLVLETPALENLSFRHNTTEVSIVTPSLYNLRKSDITCLVLQDRTPYGSCTTKLLKNLTSVEFLKLSFKMMTYDPERWYTLWRGLVDEIDDSCFNELPTFDNLVHLELSIPSCDCVLLPDLLQRFPNLKHISIDKVFGIKEAEVCWKEPLQVPICLSSTLSSFCFRGFEGFEVEVELVKYVTKHATVLKNMTLKTSTNFKAFEARAEATHGLTMVLRGSKACQFHII